MGVVLVAICFNYYYLVLLIYSPADDSDVSIGAHTFIPRYPSRPERLKIDVDLTFARDASVMSKRKHSLPTPYSRSCRYILLQIAGCLNHGVRCIPVIDSSDPLPTNAGWVNGDATIAPQGWWLGARHKKN